MKSSEASIVALKSEDGGSTYYLWTDWTKDRLSLFLICDAATAWKGEANATELKKLASSSKMSVQEYIDHCQNVALKGGNDHSYVLDGDCFSWKKSTGKGMKFKVGYLKLTEVPLSEAIPNMLSLCSGRMDACDKKLKDHDNEITRLRKELSEAKEQLQQSALDKRSAEDDLYDCFLQLLNSKKEKIKQLERQLENVDAHRSETQKSGVASDEPSGSRDKNRSTKQPLKRKCEQSSGGSGRGVKKEQEDETWDSDGDDDRQRASNVEKRSKPASAIDDAYLVETQIDNDDDSFEQQTTSDNEKADETVASKRVTSSAAVRVKAENGHGDVTAVKKKKQNCDLDESFDDLLFDEPESAGRMTLPSSSTAAGSSRNRAAKSGGGSSKVASSSIPSNPTAVKKERAQQFQSQSLLDNTLDANDLFDEF